MGFHMRMKPQIERGHEEPFLRQFSVFLPNRIGELNELLRIMEASDVEVVGVSVVDATDWAVVRLMFAEPDKAREVLAARKIPFTECDVLAVVLNEPKTLQQVCQVLVGTELNIQFAYPLLIQREGKPVMVFHVDDETVAVQTLRKHGFTLLDHENE